MSDEEPSADVLQPDESFADEEGMEFATPLGDEDDEDLRRTLAALARASAHGARADLADVLDDGVDPDAEEEDADADDGADGGGDTEEEDEEPLEGDAMPRTDESLADEYVDDDDFGFRRVYVADADVVPFEADLVGKAPRPDGVDPAAVASARATVDSLMPGASEGDQTTSAAASADAVVAATRNKKEAIFDWFDLKVVYQRGRTGFEESKDFQVRIGSIVAGRYQVLEYLGSAAFSKAVQCYDVVGRRHVCIKIIKNNKDFLDQSLDEIKLLQYINAGGDVDQHHVLRLLDYFYFKEHLFIVSELLKENLYEFAKYNRESGDEPYFTLPRLQHIARQILRALEYIHSLQLMHCDLKPENILLKDYATGDIKMIDFGSSCFVTDHLSSYVQSRSYRAPEVVLGLPYGPKIDVWSVGCIIAELWTGKVLFQNESVQSMLARIASIAGPFPEDMLRSARFASKFFTRDGIPYERRRRGGAALLIPKRTTLMHRLHTDDALFVDFVSKLLALRPQDRPTASEALQHPWLTQAVYA